MARRKVEITTTVEFTEGAIERITDAFVDLYYQIMAGNVKFDGTFPEHGSSTKKEDHEQTG